MIGRLLRLRSLDARMAPFLIIASINAAIMPDLRLWLPLVALALVLAPPRAHQFEMTLPIPGRTLFLARLVRVAPTMIPIVVWLIAPHVRARPLWSGTYTTEVAITVSAISVLAAILPSFISPRDAAVPRVRVALLWCGLAAASAATLYLLPPIASATMFTLSAAVAVGVVMRAVPESYTLDAPSASRARAVVRTTIDTPSTRLSAWLTACRPVVRAMVTPLRLTMLLLLGFSAAFTNGFNTYCVVAVGSLALARKDLRFLETLPLSYRARFLLLLTPTVFASTASLSLGALVQLPYLRSRSLFSGAPNAVGGYDAAESRSKLPLEYWATTHGGAAVSVRTEWGETQRMYTIRLLGTTYYNPYAAPDGSSERFVQMQHARATKAVYGRTIPIREYRAQQTSLPPRTTQRPRVRILTLGALLAFAFCVVMLTEITNSRRFRGSARRRAVLSFVVGTPILCLILLPAYYIRTGGSDMVAALARRAMLHLADALPSNILVVLLVASAPALLLYRLAEWQFARSESPAEALSVRRRA